MTLSKPVSQDQTVALLQLSLVQWSIAGEVNVDSERGYTLSTADTVVTIKRAPTGLPFRWTVDANDHRRTANSIAGLLRHVRFAIGADVQPMSMNFAAPVNAFSSSHSPSGSNPGGMRR